MARDRHLTPEFEPVRAIWRQAQWPGVEEGLNWGTAALKVKDKPIALTLA